MSKVTNTAYTRRNVFCIEDLPAVDHEATGIYAWPTRRLGRHGAPTLVRHAGYSLAVETGGRFLGACRAAVFIPAAGVRRR